MENVNQFDFTSTQTKPVSYFSDFHCLKINKINSYAFYRSQSMFSIINKNITKSFENKW